MRIKGEESRLVFINDKVSNVCFKATKEFKKGSLIVEYSGELISREEGYKREKEKPYWPQDGAITSKNAKNGLKCYISTAITHSPFDLEACHLTDL